MENVNELKNYWNDKERVLKAEQEALEELEKSNINKIRNNSSDDNEKSLPDNSLNQMNFNISSKENKDENKEKINIPLLILFLIFFGLSIWITYLIITKLSGIEEKNTIQQQRAEEYKRNNYIQQQQNKNNREKTIINQRNSIRLDNNIYSDNLYNIAYVINNYYKDYEFTKNLQPFFNILSKIVLPSNDKIYEFEIKGMLSQYGNFTYVIYKRTNILEYDNQIIQELNRLKTIKFREQSKDVHFSLTITNQYKLIR